MSQVKAPIVKEADPAADKSIWQDGEESLDEEVILRVILLWLLSGYLVVT